MSAGQDGGVGPATSLTAPGSQTAVAAECVMTPLIPQSVRTAPRAGCLEGHVMTPV